MANRIEFEKGVYGYDVYPGSEIKVSLSASDKKPYVNSSSENGKNSGEALKNAEISLMDLRNSYARELKAQYDHAANKLKAERDDALRENWILQQQEEANLPEVLAAEGINGGGAETTVSDIKARYQGNRNDIRKGYTDELGDIFMSHSKDYAEGARKYSEKWLDFLLSLAENEDEFEKDLELKKYR